MSDPAKRHPATIADLLAIPEEYRRHEIIDGVLVGHPDGYVEVLIADREERVRAEPFEAIDLRVGVLFGDDDDD